MLLDREKILRRIKPSKDEIRRDLALAERVIDTIKVKFGFEAILVGSVARGTALRGDKDLDIFVLLDKKTDKSELERIVDEVGRKIAKEINGRFEKHYAQHPYAKIILKDRRVEIVPAYRIIPGSPVISAVDRTPHHNEYVKSKLKNPDEVLLLKWFMKQIGVYGAEIKTRGFSGYLCELLIIKYGSFERVIEEASVWEPQIIIDIEEQYENQEEIKRLFDNPLVVIDPVDKSRNVAAPVSMKRLGEFILASKMLIETKELPKRGKRKLNGKKLIVVRWNIKPENEEVIWSQLESFAKRLQRRLEDEGFVVKDVRWWTDSLKIAEILLDLDSWELSDIEVRQGPYAFDFQNTRKFIEKYGSVWIEENGRLMAERKRKIKTAKEVISQMAKEAPSHLGKNYKIIPPSKSKVIFEYAQSSWRW